jgi:peptidoglycan/LPS O-acetylase OafA/YrhL
VGERDLLATDPDASPVGERLGYVPGLDGVRAIAVVAVMAFHGGISRVSGGFLGVDVFFVLSGFLITSLLLGEARHAGTIRLGSFWARRARRLLPALLLVLCFVGLYAWLAVPQGTYPGLRLDSLSTLFYVANWHFILEGQSYFTAALAPSPLTHTWSLAIEEQFYLVWPLVVLAFVKLRRGPVSLLCVALLGTAASTVWMAVLFRAGANPTRLYYGTDTHAMGILCGAALAAFFAILSRGTDPAGLRARGAASAGVQAGGFAGLLILGYMFVHTTGKTAWLYQGGFLVAAVATAAVLVSVVTAPKGALAVVLGWGPVRYVGRISYGLYLWHYPLFLWLNSQHTGLAGHRLLALRVAVTFAVATASFYLVERPIRHGFVLRGLSATVATAGAVAATIAVILATTMAAALPALSSLPPQPPYHDPVRALLLGDSTMYTLYQAIAPWGRVNDVLLENGSIKGCGVTITNAQIEHGVSVPTNYPCADDPQGHATIYERWSADVAAFRPDVVAILAGRWEVHDVYANGSLVNITQPAFRADVAAGLTRAVRIAGSRGARVVLMTQPCADSGEQPNGEPWPEDSPARIATYNAIVRGVAARTGASVQDLFTMVCPNRTFEETIDGIRVRSPDGVHFARSGGPYLAPRVLPILTIEGRQAQAAVG